jgi:hypothetical protein
LAHDTNESKPGKAVMGVPELTATPVTLGVVLAIWSLFGTGLAYVLGQTSDIRTGLQRLEVSQEKLGGRIEAIASSVAATKEVVAVRLQALEPQQMIAASETTASASAKYAPEAAMAAALDEPKPKRVKINGPAVSH